MVGIFAVISILKINFKIDLLKTLKNKIYKQFKQIHRFYYHIIDSADKSSSINNLFTP